MPVHSCLSLPCQSRPSRAMPRPSTPAFPCLTEPRPANPVRARPFRFCLSLLIQVLPCVATAHPLLATPAFPCLAGTHPCYFTISALVGWSCIECRTLSRLMVGYYCPHLRARAEQQPVTTCCIPVRPKHRASRVSEHGRLALLSDHSF